MIKFIVLDFDGVFTDGKFYFDNDDNLKKCYNGKDAYSLKIIKKYGIKCAIITNDKVISIEHAPHIFNRLDKVSLGSDKPKLEILDSWLDEYGFTYEDVAYIGDDLPDIPIMEKVAFSACPSDAVEDVKEVSQYLCKNRGGEGAVREFVDLIIKKNLTKVTNNICFCIPARFNSSRLDKKLLLPLGSKTCVQRTVCSLYSSKYYDDNIFVFTDSEEIMHNLKEYNCNVILTIGDFKNGTDRISKNLQKIHEKYNIIVNVQGDEPFISYKNVDHCIDKHLMNNNSEVFYTTLHEINNTDEYLKSSASLKVVLDKYNNVIYYSRNIIPSNKKHTINSTIKYNTFTGIYVYNKSKIIEYGKLNDSFLQNEEDCEQLKLIENGYKIKSYETIEYNEISLNTKEDYDYLLNKYCNGQKFFHLDCTLRDGGYINNWNFSKEFISDYINLMNESNVDYVEIGFANKTIKYKGDIVGPSRNIDINYLNLFKSINAKIAVMCDYNDVNMSLLENNVTLERVDLVRIAFHKHDLDNAIKMCNTIKNLGYKVSANAMAITNYNNKDLKHLFDLVNENELDILYIADSYGSLNNVQVREYINKFNMELSNTTIGIHLHNNMNNAFNNFVTSQEVLTKELLYIDSTLFGIGRGAGNLQSELVLNYKNIDIETIVKTVVFINKYLFQIYNNRINTSWGYNLDYFLSGLFKVHPNYINKFRELKLRLNDKIFLIRRILMDKKGGQFSREYINNIIDECCHYFLN
jgi:4-hydroxy 2-oxovalerate aldolase